MTVFLPFCGKNDRFGSFIQTKLSCFWRGTKVEKWSLNNLKQELNQQLGG
jgi:hypothetical protein